MLKRIWSLLRNPFLDQQEWDCFRFVVPSLLLVSVLSDLSV